MISTPSIVSPSDETGASRGPYAMQQRKHDAGRNACSHGEDDDRGRGRKNQHELAESVPENRDDLPEAHDAHRDEDQNARKRG